MDNTVLNLTGADHHSRLQQLLEGFAGLAEGACLEVHSDTDPASLLPDFQAQHWGSFDWYPLAKSTSHWTIALSRLKGGQQVRSIREMMGLDHERCDDLYAALENTAQSGDKETTRQRFEAFAIGMEHHFNMEENGFFPAFERATGMTQGPTMVMRMEHRQLLGVIAQMRQAVDQGDTTGVTRAGTTLMVLMRQHNIKEEQMLYPMGDMHLGDVQPLLKQMQLI